MSNQNIRRVGAILGSKDDIIEFLGYGNYAEDAVPKEAVGFMADILRKNNTPNPKIVLDNGKVVYGCECWWGGEEKVKKIIMQAKKVTKVDIDKVRLDYEDTE